MKKITSIIAAVKEKVSGISCNLSGVVAGSAAASALVLSSFAADPEIAITTEMLTPVVDQIIANIAVVMPVGLTLFGIMAGIALVPRLIHRFMG